MRKLHERYEGVWMGWVTGWACGAGRVYGVGMQVELSAQMK